jgi:hypothetical protein
MIDVPLLVIEMLPLIDKINLIINFYYSLLEVKRKLLVLKPLISIIILFLFSQLITFSFSYLDDKVSILGIPASNDIVYGILVTSSNNAQNILSDLSQILASIFGIFFGFIFIIIQFQIQSKAASPHAIRRYLKSKKLCFTIFIFISTILLNMISIRSIDTDIVKDVNIFFPLSLAVFIILLLLYYMRDTLLYTMKNALIEEIRSGQARYDLEAVDLSNIELPNINLQERILNKANFFMTNLSNANLSSSILNAANLEHARLHGTKMNGAKLDHVRLNSSQLNNANLSGASLNYADLKYADLSSANLSNADLTRADMRRIYYDKNFINSLISAKNISNAYFSPNLGKELFEAIIAAGNAPPKIIINDF